MTEASDALSSVQVETGPAILVEGGSLKNTNGLQDGRNELQDKQDDCVPCRSPLDDVLIEALRIPRDRTFVLMQEKDMEDRIRSGQEQVWELPLMNSYQRLLVHRIADHFHLAHSIDAITKAVTLTRQADTEIPELSLSTLAMADMERLSEPAYAVSREGSASSFKIMRREGAGRTHSPRNGMADEKGIGKDRRNLTIEEREAAYKEARQRIFGSEEGCGEAAADCVASTSGDVDVKGLSNLSLDVEQGSKGDSRKGTPGRLSPAPSSASSTSSAAFLRAGAPSFDPNQRTVPVEAHWQAPPYGYPIVDVNGNQYIPYAGGFVWPPYVQHDANGRQIRPQGATPLMSPSYYPFSTPGSSGSNQDVYSSVGHSPSVSSRSTSISADTEGDGGQTSLSRNSMLDQSHGGMTTASRGRPHSISPSASFQHPRNGGSYHPSGSSNGSSSGGASNLMPPHVFQGQVPVPASWSSYPCSPSTYTNRPYQQAPTYNSEEGGARNLQNQRMGYAAALANSSRGSGPVASSSSSVHSSESASGYLGPVASSSSRIDEASRSMQGRGRNGLSDRSLYDPNRPLHATSSPASRQDEGGRVISINKSNSAAGLLEGRPNGDLMRAGSTNTTQSSMTSGNGRRESSTSTSPSDSSRRVTSPSHPSLPPRPDWVLPAKSKPAIDKSTTEEHITPQVAS